MGVHILITDLKKNMKDIVKKDLNDLYKCFLFKKDYEKCLATCFNLFDKQFQNISYQQYIKLNPIEHICAFITKISNIPIICESTYNIKWNKNILKTDISNLNYIYFHSRHEHSKKHHIISKNIKHNIDNNCYGIKEKYPNMKPLNSKQLTEIIENIVKSTGLSYQDAIINYAEDNSIEIEVIASIVKRSAKLKAELYEEAEQLNLVEVSGSKIPGI